MILKKEMTVYVMLIVCLLSLAACGGETTVPECRWVCVDAHHLQCKGSPWEKRSCGGVCEEIDPNTTGLACVTAANGEGQCVCKPKPE